MSGHHIDTDRDTQGLYAQQGAFSFLLRGRAMPIIRWEITHYGCLGGEPICVPSSPVQSSPPMPESIVKLATRTLRHGPNTIRPKTVKTYI